MNFHHVQPEQKKQFDIQLLTSNATGVSPLQAGSGRLSSYEINWFVTAGGSLVSDAETYGISDNTVTCLVPGQVRRFYLSKPAEGYHITFTDDFLLINHAQAGMASWVQDLHADNRLPVVQPDEFMRLEIGNILQSMQREFDHFYLLRSELISGLLNILLMYLSRKFSVKENPAPLSKDLELFRRFKSLLKTHFTTRRSVHDYAALLCISPNHLSKTVKKMSGHSASYHIQQQIVVEAKRQIIHSNNSMKEIAYGLGFDNLAHFSKFFKNNCGMNFSNFKRGLQVSG